MVSEVLVHGQVSQWKKKRARIEGQSESLWQGEWNLEQIHQVQQRVILQFLEGLPFDFGV